MTQLDQFAIESISATLLQMLLRIIATWQRRESLEVAVVGNTQTIMAMGETLSDDERVRVALNYFGQYKDFYTKIVDDFRPGHFGVVIIVGQSIEEEMLLFQRLRALDPQLGERVRPVIFWSRLFSSFLTTLCNLDNLPTCLNYRKLTALAAAAYLSSPTGSVFECGVYFGGTTVFLAEVEKQLGRNRPIYGFDTFNGMPAPIEQDTADGGAPYPEGFFNETSLEQVQSFLHDRGCLGAINLIQGRIEETLPGVVAASAPCAYALLDLDQYAGIHAALSILLANPENSPIILIDDVSISGVEKAIVEGIGEKPVGRMSLTTNVDVLVPLDGIVQL